ncbi:hypothetical protein SISSUDRAFT_1067329 [Sistotremastrum suecicum HHB10207 ss-3]|uniref:G-protein coupled receptors family 1 profile domain-containing protein n=1 Tax=Sistotremastrum suecicum HHB10207 ss-3 TaxID=1314776 RepID=A0A165X8J6_9AGAM|nr:hypothetical protein SISSUDRAFT_1067329 [Sistotremastrum suecicum HHB10207 ss-3]
MSPLSLSYPVDARGTFPDRVRLQLSFKVQAAFLAASTIIILLVLIARRARRLVQKHGICELLRSSPMHIFFLSLLCADLVEDMSSIMDARWVHDAGILEGTYCQIQAILRQSGGLGVALTILAIAVTTWGCLVKQWSSPSPKVAAAVVASIWLFVILMAVIGPAVHRSHPFYGSTTYWCFIRMPYTLPGGIACFYVWVWTSAILNFLLYIWIVVKLLQLRRRPNSDQQSQQEKKLHKLALQTAWYPLVYFITVAPVSITRTWQFAKPNHPPFPIATIMSGMAFDSSGFFNVILFSLTRPGIILGEAPERTSFETFMTLTHITIPPGSKTATSSESRDTTLCPSTMSGMSSAESSLNSVKDSTPSRGRKSALSLDLHLPV